MSPVEICGIAQPLHENCRLGALAGARRAEHHDPGLSLGAVIAPSLPRMRVPFANPSYWREIRWASHLPDGVERHAHDDQQRRAAEEERNVPHVEDGIMGRTQTADT